MFNIYIKSLNKTFYIVLIDMSSPDSTKNTRVIEKEFLSSSTKLKNDSTKERFKMFKTVECPANPRFNYYNQFAYNCNSVPKT